MDIPSNVLKIFTIPPNRQKEKLKIVIFQLQNISCCLRKVKLKYLSIDIINELISSLRNNGLDYLPHNFKNNSNGTGSSLGCYVSLKKVAEKSVFSNKGHADSKFILL